MKKFIKSIVAMSAAAILFFSVFSSKSQVNDVVCIWGGEVCQEILVPCKDGSNGQILIFGLKVPVMREN